MNPRMHTDEIRLFPGQQPAPDQAAGTDRQSGAPAAPKSSLPSWLLAPRRLACAVALDRLAPCWLMVSLLLATWPQWIWMARRMVDGSDDPLGVLALLALLAVVWVNRRGLRQSPDLSWLLAAMALMGAGAWAQANLPDLAAALLAMLGLVCGLRALLPRRVASAPLLVLAVLALPLMASLQYFVGYPLRVLVAEATLALMQAAHHVQREGTALVVDGQLVLIDAACSGVQLAWMGYFSAACLALVRGLDTRRFLSRLPWVSVWVLGGNIVRSWLLVTLQANGQPLATWLHEGIGLVCLAVVCGGIAWQMRPALTEALPQRTGWMGPAAAWRVPNQLRWRLTLKAACLGIMPVLAVAHAVVLGQHPEARPQPASVEWPRTWQGKPLRPLALGAVEQRFAANFPGQLARLTNGEDLLVWRHVSRPTRMLHPAADCYRALGYQVKDEHLSSAVADTQDHSHAADAASLPATQGLWRCFIADKDGQRLRVCERLEDAQGRVFTDTSAWYWAASLGQSTGPWQALTVAQAL